MPSSQLRRHWAETPARIALAVLFLCAGALHFLYPHQYAQIVRPMLPHPLWLVFISGICEIAGGVGLLIRHTRRWAAYALVLLLIAVFPANLYMAWAHVPVAGITIPTWALWARLPLQLPLIWWALRYTRPN